MIDLSVNKKKFYEIIDKIIDNSKLSHAYLIEINDYDIDFQDILNFIKMILLNKNSEFVFNDNSNISYLVNNLSYPDLKIIEPEGQWIKKNQLLNLQEDFKNKSLFNNKRIYIIKEADRLNSSSANTILKFLEEPESNVIGILLTKNRYHVLDTILSRCQILSLSDDYSLCEFSDETIEFLNFILNKEDLFINYNYIVSSILVEKKITKKILSEIEFILLRYVNNNFSFLSDKTINLIKKYDIDEIVNIISVIEEELLKLDYNVNFKLWMDCFFAKIIGGK